MFDGLKARLDKLMAEHGPDLRGEAAGLREALIEARAAVAAMRDGLGATERELAHEREQLATAERRGRLAAGIDDGETAAVAERYATKHRDRSAVLERKLAVQREELALAEREVAEMTARFREIRPGAGGASAQAARAGLDAAWRDLEAAGGVRPDTDLDGELQRADAERRLHEAAVEAQLAHLKRKLGKE